MRKEGANIFAYRNSVQSIAPKKRLFQKFFSLNGSIQQSGNFARSLQGIKKAEVFFDDQNFGQICPHKSMALANHYGFNSPQLAA